MLINLVRGALWLARANLEGAHLLRPNLDFADLEGANLRGVELMGADLSGANLNAEFNATEKRIHEFLLAPEDSRN